MPQLLRRTLVTGASALALSFSAAALGWSFTWGAGESVAGDGQARREQRSVATFEAVALSGPIEVKLRQGGAQRVELEADGNLLPYVETKVVEGRHGKTLEIGVRRGYHLQSRQPLRVEIDVASLRSAAIAGSGKLAIEAMKGEELRLSVAGSGSVEASRLETGKLGLSIAGSGDIRASGAARELAASIAGSGDLRARELAAEEVKVSISGSGDAEVQAVKRLKVSIAGSGDVRYAGEAQVESSIAGSGSVRKL